MFLSEMFSNVDDAKDAQVVIDPVEAEAIKTDEKVEEEHSDLHPENRVQSEPILGAEKQPVPEQIKDIKPLSLDESLFDEDWEDNGYKQHVWVILNDEDETPRAIDILGKPYGHGDSYDGRYQLDYYFDSYDDAVDFTDKIPGEYDWDVEETDEEPYMYEGLNNSMQEPNRAEIERATEVADKQVKGSKYRNYSGDRIYFNTPNGDEFSVERKDAEIDANESLNEDAEYDYVASINENFRENLRDLVEQYLADNNCLDPDEHVEDLPEVAEAFDNLCDIVAGYCEAEMI